MHKLNVIVSIFLMLVVSLLSPIPLYAISNDLMISQLKIGNSSTARLVEVYNNSSEPLDITGWCLRYYSSTNTLVSPALGCFNGFSTAYHEFISAKSYILLASTQTGLTSDITLSPGLGTGLGGHVYIFDATNKEVDRVGWGTAVNPENSAVILGESKIIERKVDKQTSEMIDTDDNASDFFGSTLRTQYQYGSIYEEVDVCMNIAGIQTSPPENYSIDEFGNCNPPPVDVCTNLDGLQTTIPEGFLNDESGNCQKDICFNLEGLQQLIPSGYKLKSEGECAVNLPPIRITELLPNPNGIDTGNEFIEIFNPNNSSIDLKNYRLRISDDLKDIAFPDGSSIPANSYISFSNSDIDYTLVNSLGGVNLYSVDGDLIDATQSYSDAKDGESWALINDTWRYTNNPTPGTANNPSVYVTVVKSTSTSRLKPCAPGEYRNPETNRCKKMVVAVSALKPCKTGQYRSEETHRCRSIAGDVLGASTLKPCKPGQERDPETNRCRNVIKGMPAADYAPEQVDTQSDNPVMLWSLTGLGAAAAGYGFWEWRREIASIFKK